jgi:hypothetical protein
VRRTLLLGFAAVTAFFVWAGSALAGPPRAIELHSSSFNQPGANYAVASDDFNIDGASDLAISDQGHNAIVVRMSNFDGTFGAPTSYPLGSGNTPNGLRAADVNGDGLMDVVAALQSGRVAILLNDWSHIGTFDTPVVENLPTLGSATCANPTEVTVGDLNDDGKQDLAFACYASDYVLVLYNSGDGVTFAGYWIWFEADGPISIGIGDLNQDAHNDLVVADWFSNQVAVMMNNKHGVFPTVVDYSVPGTPNEIALGDFNEDGNVDVAVSKVNNGLSTLAGNGNGTLAPPVNIPTGHTTYWVYAGDMNGDGHLDLVSPENVTQKLDVHLGNGDGTFTAPQQFDISGHPGSEALGDFDWDGRPDVSTLSDNGDITTFMNNTAGGTWTSLGPQLNATVGKIISVGTWPSLINFPVLNPGQSSGGFDYTSTFVKTNDNAGYQLSIHRTPFSAGDIPLAINQNCFTSAINDLPSGYNQIPTTGSELNVNHRDGGSFPYFDFSCYFLKLGPVPFVNAGTHHAQLVWTATGF